MEEIVAEKFIKEYPTMCKDSHLYDKLTNIATIMKAFDDIRFYTAIQNLESVIWVSAMFKHLKTLEGDDLIMLGGSSVGREARDSLSQEKKDAIHELTNKGEIKTKLERHNVQVVCTSERDGSYTARTPVAIVKYDNACTNVSLLNYIAKKN